MKEYCRVLAAFGLHQKDLVFEGCDGSGSKKIPVDWYKKWGLTARDTCKIISSYGEKAKRIAPGEWLSITPCPAFRDGKKYARAYFDAFKFAMLMASIRFGFGFRPR